MRVTHTSSVMPRVLRNGFIVHSRVPHQPRSFIRPSSSSSSSSSSSVAAPAQSYIAESEQKDDSYTARQERITREQRILQLEINLRVTQLQSALKRLRAVRRKSRSQELFQAFVDDLKTQYMALARKNRDVASEREVLENERAFKKLVWFDALENADSAPTVASAVMPPAAGHRVSEAELEGKHDQ